MRLEEAATDDGGSEERRFPRAATAALVAAALLGLLVVIALGARGGHPSTHGRVAQRDVPGRVSNDLLTVFIVVYALGCVALVAALIAAKGKWLPTRRNWLRDYFIVLVALCVVTCVGLRLAHSRALRQARERAEKQRLARADGRSGFKPKGVTSGGAHVDWTLASGIIGLLIVGGAIYYVRSRRPLPDRAELEDDAVAIELSAALSDAIDDLENEADARLAVIAAYARMEGALARGGVARRPAEAPFEYLSRILGDLNVRRAAARELTELFERAKFSVHPIDADMKRRAISAFVAVRDDLRQPVAA